MVRNFNLGSPLYIYGLKFNPIHFIYIDNLDHIFADFVFSELPQMEGLDIKMFHIVSYSVRRDPPKGIFAE